MFVHDFNCGWLQHPFYGQPAQDQNEKQVETIINYPIREVYIDTDRELDVPDAPTRQDLDQQIRFAPEGHRPPGTRRIFAVRRLRIAG
jgi:hypothetical protein